MAATAQIFGAWWPCLLLAGLWSLGCGYFLRRAWTAETDEDNAAQLAASRNEVLRLRAEVEARNGRVHALEAELVGHRSRAADVEAGNAADLQRLTAKLASHEAKVAGFDLARETSLKALAERDRSIAELNARLQSAEGAVADARAHAEAGRTAGQPPAADASARRDDLKVIEGIGPKIETLLNDAGYRRFSDVAAADPRALAAILERAGPRFALARSDTWPQQAQLLNDGNMEAFKKLIDELKGGVRR